MMMHKAGAGHHRWIRAAALVHRRLWWLRAVTLGARAIIFDEAGRIMLLRHTYIPGWHFPGGGVDRGETAEAAVIREMREEAGLRCKGRPVLHGLFRNVVLKRDHVACFIVRDFERLGDVKPDWEIAETGFFAPDDLPPGTSAATRARLAEVLQGAPIAVEW